MMDCTILIGAFTLAIWSTFMATEKFSQELYTHFLRSHGQKSSIMGCAFIIVTVWTEKVIQ